MHNQRIQHNIIKRCTQTNSFPGVYPAQFGCLYSYVCVCSSENGNLAILWLFFTFTWNRLSVYNMPSANFVLSVGKNDFRNLTLFYDATFVSMCMFVVCTAMHQMRLMPRMEYVTMCNLICKFIPNALNTSILMINLRV